MRRIAFILFFSVLMISCGTSKTVKDSKKVIKGEWVLNSIVYNDYGTFRISFFRNVTKNCLEGSNWQFIPNNNTGTYVLSGEYCASGEQHFIFTIDEVNPETGLYDFLLKPTDAKKKSVDNKGFRMHLTHLSDTEMRWEQKSSIDGVNISMNLNFSKTNK